MVLNSALKYDRGTAGQGTGRAPPDLLRRVLGTLSHVPSDLLRRVLGILSLEGTVALTDPARILTEMTVQEEATDSTL